MDIAVPRGVRYAYVAGLVVAGPAPLVPTLIFNARPSDIVAAASLLLVAAACLLLSMARGREAPWTEFGGPAAAAVPGLLVLTITLWPALVMSVVMPVVWVRAIWSGWPDGLGLLPPGVTYPFEVVFGAHQPLAVLMAAAAAGIFGYAVRRHARAVREGVGLIAPVALPLAVAASGAPWPALPASLLGIGLALTAWAAVAQLGPWRRTVAALPGFMYIFSALAMFLATPISTVVAFAVTAAAAAACVRYARPQARTPAAVLVVAAACPTAAAAVLAAGGTHQQAAFGPLGVAVAALVVAVPLRPYRRRQASALEACGHLAVMAALPWTFGSLPAARIVVGVWAVATTARVAWPRLSASDRRFLASYAAAWLALLWCLLLGVPEQLNEAQTLPFAVPLLIGGWAARRRWSDLGRLGYAPAVLVATAPTLMIGVNTRDLWRVTAIVVVALGGVVWLLVSRLATKRHRRPA